MTRPTCVVVLAAGEGTRMRSARPKALHHLCGRPMIMYVLDAASHENVRATVVVVGHGATWVENSLKERLRNDDRLSFVEQPQQLGTGHAVSVALPTIAEKMGDVEGDVLILPGDAPLLRHETVQQLLTHHRESQAALTVLGARVEDPFGYGRLVYAKDGTLARIVEERDATSDERDITEINTSIMVVRESLLGPALRMINRQNSQNEYYLTDLVSALHDAGHITNVMVLEDSSEAQGVNDRAQLASAETVLRERINHEWMMRGVTMWDPRHTYIDADVVIEPDVSLLPGTILKGHCAIERGAQIGPNANLTDCRVGRNAVVGTVEAVEADIGDDALVKAFVVIGKGSRVHAGEVIASFEYHTR
ncbi:MAG: bifunctional UDP-N-acetylglucosamine diphosphorylase/glucosamine-1-phosphate N-acetyltransferase GlmU [Acidimicrobiales bacterium]